MSTATEEQVAITVRLSKSHKRALDTLIDTARPVPTAKSMIEHLIEKEAAERGIDLQSEKPTESDS